MNAPDGGWRGAAGAPPRRVLAIVAAGALMLTGVVLGGRALVDRGTLEAPPPPPPGGPGARPIAEEAGAFRLGPGDLAVPTAEAPRSQAHPRTLDRSRTLRAYPGAPPRIPHGLTDEEFRRPTCNSCHQRGGYVTRFAAYAPVTPHPEYADCLQCHVADRSLIGPRPAGRPEERVCLQCHVLDAETPLFRTPLDWPAPRWPEPARSALPEGPPPIPHDLQLRGNCVACHAGPSAAVEIRTSHPERANCRQCHLPAAASAGEFARPAAALDSGAGT